MISTTQAASSEAGLKPARDWLKTLAEYREPSSRRSLFELLVTLIPFFGLWIVAWWVYPISVWLTLAIGVVAGCFLVRLFLIQHDCGHGAFFRQRATNDWVGRFLGVLTLTPYGVWRRSHATHHATSGNLSRRGIGDIDTLTVREYLARPFWRRAVYRLYRHPIVMFGVGPAYYFMLRNRLPLGFSKGDLPFWISTMGTNIAIAMTVAALIYLMGPGPFLLVHMPIALIAASIGVWLFYVQHQFEDTFWAEEPDWKLHDAALYGSSHYDLPIALRWMSANIGVHHVHHIASRIPYYRLPQVLRDYPELSQVRRLTLMQSFACVRLRLWDENKKKLVSFSEAFATS